MGLQIYSLIRLCKKKTRNLHPPEAESKAITHQLHTAIDKYKAGHHENMAQVLVIEPRTETELCAVDHYRHDGKGKGKCNRSASFILPEPGGQKGYKYGDYADAGMYLEDLEIVPCYCQQGKENHENDIDLMQKSRRSSR